MNWKQILSMLSSINGGLVTGAALLQTLFGQDLTIKIVAVLGITQIIIGSINQQLSNQTNLVKDVLAMPGVAKVEVNENANKTLASIAMDPAVNNISPTPNAMNTVSNTAKGV